LFWVLAVFSMVFIAYIIIGGLINNKKSPNKCIPGNYLWGWLIFLAMSVLLIILADGKKDEQMITGTVFLAVAIYWGLWNFRIWHTWQQIRYLKSD